MRIGSGDIPALLAGKNTKSHNKLLTMFVSDTRPYYNAKASPIDALRTGAILEDRYLLTLDDSYYPQYRVESDEMNVLVSTLDFAKIDKGKVVDFDELKTCWFDDYIKFENLDESERLTYLKKKYKANYNQVQQQLYCSGLDSANIVFLVVYTYDDLINYSRDIQSNEYFKIRIERDEKVIYEIMERATIFQTIKNYYE
jgi:hypothetical protein